MIYSIEGKGPRVRVVKVTSSPTSTTVTVPGPSSKSSGPFVCVIEGVRNPGGGTTRPEGQGTPHTTIHPNLTRSRYRHDDPDRPHHRNVGEHTRNTQLQPRGCYTSTSPIALGLVLHEIVTDTRVLP